MRKLFIPVALLLYLSGYGMDTLIVRKGITHGTLSASAIGSIVGLNQVWYKQYQTVPFHGFNDSRNWMQMDKCGHGYTAFMLTKEINCLHAWASSKPAPWVGAIYAFSYLSALEVMDGYSSGWGFSGADMVANGVGVLMAYSQDRYFKNQVYLPKFSFSRSDYASLRPAILGSTFGEQVLKDYNGQTYWLSIPLYQIVSLPKSLRFICLSFGYGCDAKLVGDVNLWNGYQARRQFYFSLDLDYSRVFPRHPKLSNVLSHLNFIKLPFPSLEFSADKTRFHWISF